jgi:hypothetical protein
MTWGKVGLQLVVPICLHLHIIWFWITEILFLNYNYRKTKGVLQLTTRTTSKGDIGSTDGNKGDLKTSLGSGGEAAQRWEGDAIFKTTKGTSQASKLRFLGNLRYKYKLQIWIWNKTIPTVQRDPCLQKTLIYCCNYLLLFVFLIRPKLKSNLVPSDCELTLHLQFLVFQTGKSYHRCSLGQSFRLRSPVECSEKRSNCAGTVKSLWACSTTIFKYIRASVAGSREPVLNTL